MAAGAHGYEKAFERTDVGTIEAKSLPASRVLVAAGEGGYFKNSNKLFGRLFGYIRQNEVAMTVPVQANVAAGEMLFFVGGDADEKELASSALVTVTNVPARQVVSYGGRGSYTEDRFGEAVEALTEWLAAHPAYVAAGEAYAIYWNSPFVPGFLKRYEVHVPVEPAAGEDSVEDDGP
jgi:hypothetical protein